MLMSNPRLIVDQLQQVNPIKEIIIIILINSMKLKRLFKIKKEKINLLKFNKLLNKSKKILMMMIIKLKQNK